MFALLGILHRCLIECPVILKSGLPQSLVGSSISEVAFHLEDCKIWLGSLPNDRERNPVLSTHNGEIKNRI